jgi:hypothetical protein
MLNAQITIVAINIRSTGLGRRMLGTYPQAPAGKAGPRAITARPPR